MKRKRWLKRLFLVLLLVGGVGAGCLLLGSSESQPEYRTEKVTRGNIAAVVAANGTLNPAQVVTVGTQVSGQVRKLNVKLNDKVKAGQLLAEIDPTLLLTQIKQDQATLETAKSNYEQASRDLERTRVLLAKDYVAKVDLEHAEQAYLTAKNSYEGAKTVVERDQANLNYAKITAPIDGVVIAKEIDLGQTVAASFQTPNLFKIAADLTKMKISVNLPEAFISKVKAGMAVTFTVDAFSGRSFDGVINAVDLNPSMQNGVVAYTIEVTVENKDYSLLPGMTAYVNITLSTRPDVLRVPVSALHFSPPPAHVSGLLRLFNQSREPASMLQPAKDGKMVYVLRNRVPVPVAVKTGATDESYVEVSGEGIAEGDTVVTGLAAVKR